MGRRQRGGSHLAMAATEILHGDRHLVWEVSGPQVLLRPLTFGTRFPLTAAPMPKGVVRRKPGCSLGALLPLGLLSMALRVAADSWLSQGPAHPAPPHAGHMREARLGEAWRSPVPRRPSPTHHL